MGRATAGAPLLAMGRATPAPLEALALALALALAAGAAAVRPSSAGANCSVSLTRTVSGRCGNRSSGVECPGSWGHLSGGCPWGCAADPHTMFAIRGCCAEFECDGAAVRCCSHQHLHPQLCQCGPPPPPPAAGGVFVVDSRAEPGGNGSSARPFATIASCATVAAQARTTSTCRVRAGVYREEIVLESPLGVEIVGDGNGSTVLDGTRTLDGLSWKRYRGLVYRTTIPPGALRFPYRQLFVGGSYITEARWPNAQLSSMLDRSTWATMQEGSGWGVVHDPAMISSLSASNSSWDGGRVTLNLGTGVFTWVRPVRNFSTLNRSSFRYEAALNSLKRPPGCTDGAPCKSFVGNRYFLQGVLAALDSPGEWFLDQSTWQLYVWMPDSTPPGSASDLSVKFSDFCLRKEAPVADAAQRHAGLARPVRLSNLSFHGCTLELLDCDNCSVRDVQLTYPNYESHWVDGSCGKIDGNKCQMPAMTLLQGDNGVIDRVHLLHSNNAGIMLVGSGHTVSETLIESTDWLGSLAFPPIKIGFSIHKATSIDAFATRADGDDVEGDIGAMRYGDTTARSEVGVGVGMPAGVHNQITRSTVRGFGNSGIVTSQLANEVSFCRVSHGGLIGGDDACIHADNAPVKCDAGANCTKTWHHNYVHDCREKCVRCDDNSRDCDINHCVVFNCGQPLRNGAPAGILVKGDRNRVWACTIFNASAGGQGDLVAITEFGQNKNSQFFNVAARRIGTRGVPLSANSTAFAGGLVTDASLCLVDPLDFQFKPQKQSVLYGTGVTHAPDEPAAHPNVGAYQPSDSWVPGCTFHPRCKSDENDPPVTRGTWTKVGRSNSTQSCIDATSRLLAGGTCWVGPGVNRESLSIPASRAGPITLAGQPDGSSILSGSRIVTGPWVPSHRGNGIFESRLPAGTTTEQVFVDGTMAFEARWPNANLSTILTEGAWGVSTNSSSPSLTHPQSLGYVSAPELARSGLNFTGALLTLNAGTRVWTWTRRVVQHTPGDPTVWYRGALMPEKGRQSSLRTLFTLSELPALLDAPMEWWLDSAQSVLALRLFGGGSPTGHVVEIKERSLCISAPAALSRGRVAPPVHIANITMHGCTFNLKGCHSCSVRNVSGMYPSHTREVRPKMHHVLTNAPRAAS